MCINHFPPMSTNDKDISYIVLIYGQIRGSHPLCAVGVTWSVGMSAGVAVEEL